MKNKIKNSIPIILVMLLASFIYTWNMWNEGLSNLYYSAGVYSMGQNLHAFFYNSLDSVGFISIDKPPLGLWIQVLFTKIFGFNGSVLLLPEAIAGILSVYFIYKIISKRFNKSAGLVSSLILTLTPIFTAVCRNNTIDSILILTLILASDQAIKSAEKSSLKHLIYSGILIGLGFNIKMLQAYMIVPAVYLTYLIFSNEKISKKLLSATISVIIMVIISMSWIIAVDLTPSENRPYVGSSDTNSAFELAIGYNGVGRLLGIHSINNKTSIINKNYMPNMNNNMVKPNKNNTNSPINANSNITRPNSFNKDNVKMITNDKQDDSTSLFRLYNSYNAGQISWFLLPSLLISVYAIYLIFKKSWKQKSENITLFYFALCFISMFIYFSFSNGVVHRYYLAMLATPIAALTGIGFWYLIKNNKKYIPIIYILIVLTQLYIQTLYFNWISLLIPIYIIITIVIFVFMILSLKKNKSNIILASYMAIFLLLPAIWSLTPIIYGNNAQLPIAGPELISQKNIFNSNNDLSSLITYLTENRNNADYLVATSSAMDYGSKLILESGEPVMALGGFNGGDSPLTTEEFENLVDKQVVNFAIISNENKSKKQVSNDNITQWIIDNGTIVDKNLWADDNLNINDITLYKLN